MPWQVPITVDGLEYPVTFNTEEQPTQQDLDEAVQQILSQRGQALQPAQPAGETPGYLSQLGSALGLGYRQMKSGVGATFNALTGDTEDVAAEMAEQAKLQREQQAAQTPQDIEFMRRLDEAEKAYELARGPVETISALSQYPAAAFAEPGAAFKTAVQSAPNVLISGATSLAGYGLGGLVGGAAGIETGPGAILTGIAGAAAGGALSNTLMEAGPSIFDALNEKTNGAAANMTAEQISAFLKANPDVIEQGLKTGAIRGSVIGAVEALGVKGSGRLLTMPERAAARAAQKTLVDAGVDVTSKKAVDAALLDPTIRSATKTAAEAAKSQFSSAGNLARMAGASAIETGAAGAGELAAQAAAGQDISIKEAFMEMLGQAALSAPMAAATKAVEGAKYALTPSQEAEQPEATQAEPTVVPTAEEPPSMLPFTREDIRATELPFSRQNIRGLSMIQPEIAIAKNAIAATQNVPFTDITDQAATNIVQENARIASQLAVPTKQATEEVGAEVTPSPDQLATVEEPWQIKGREWVKKQQANLGKWASDLDRSMNQNVDSVISSGQSFFGDFVDKDGNIDDGKLSAYREIFRSKGKDLVLEKPIGNLDKWKKSGVKNFPVVDFAQPQTPSPAMEMPEEPSQTITGSNAEMAAEMPVQPVAGEATIPPEPVETQEDATIQREIPENRVEERVQIDEGGPTAETGGGNRPVVSGQVQEEVITPPGEPTTATEGMVTPGGVATERGIKPQKVGNVAAIPTPEEEARWKAVDDFTTPYVASLSDDALDSLGSKVGVKRNGVADDAYRAKILGNTHPDDLLDAIPDAIPQTTAAETQTPVPLRGGTGAAGVARSSLGGGRSPELTQVSTETETTSSEKLDPKLIEAERKQAKEEEAAVKQQEKLDQDTKSSLNSVVGPQKKDPVVGTVTKADVETAREALTNSGEIPNAYLTNVYESREAFLADKANARLFPASYARLQTEKNIEGLYENGQTLIFAKQIQVSNLDRGLAKMLGITPEQAAARRVIAHENGHKAISLFTMAEKRELRGYLMRVYSDEQIAKLVETYDEYADWRTNPESRLEALEELLMRDFERMEKIPTGGVWDDIVQFLKRVWRRLTGQKGEPKLKELKDVVRLMRNAMKRPAVPLGSYTLKDGGQVKLSMIAPTAGITPEMDAEYLAAVEAGDMEKAQRMVNEAAKRAGYGQNQYSKDDFDTWAKTIGELDQIERIAINNSISAEQALKNTNISPVLRKVAQSSLERNKKKAQEIQDKKQKGPPPKRLVRGDSRADITVYRGVGGRSIWATDSEQVAKTYGDNVRSFFLEMKNPLVVDADGRSFKELSFEDSKLDADDLSDIAKERGYDGLIIRNFYDSNTDDGGDVIADHFTIFEPSQIKSADPVTRDDQGNVIPLSQRFQSASPDIRFSRPQFSSDTSAALSAGSEAARSTLYSERDMDIREAIRRAYEAMPKTNSVAVPIGELFAKTEELMPGVTQDEFSNVLQDLFEDNGAVLQEGGVVEPLTEQDRSYLAAVESGDMDVAQEFVDKAAGRFASMEEQNPSEFSYGDENDQFFYHVTTKDRLEQVVYDGEGLVPNKGGQFAGAAAQTNSRGKVFFTERSGVKVWMDQVEQQLEQSRDYDEDQSPEDDLAVIRIPKHLVSDKQDDDPRNSPVQVGRDFFSTKPIPAWPETVVRDDQGRIIPLSRRFDTGADIRGQINVTTPEGRRAGFVVVMPRAAKASRIPIEEIQEASKPFKEYLIEASKGRDKKAAFQGNVMRGNVVPDHNVNATELYKKAANALLDSLLKNHDIIDVAKSIQDPDLQAELGMQIGGVVQPEDILNVRQYLGALLQRRLTVAISSEKKPKRLRQLELARESINAYSDGASGGGTALNNAKQVQNDPELKGDFFFSQATRKKAQKAKDKLDAITGGTEKITDIITGAEEKAAEETTQAEVEAQESAAEDDQDAIDLAAGEATLTEPEKSLYEEYKDILRRRGILDMLDKRDASAAKASISAEERNALTKLTKAERDEMRKRDDKRRMEILAKLLGKESPTDTSTQKATRQKREKMVKTAQKRAESGKDIDVQSRIESLFPLAETREEIINEVGDALLKAAEQRKVKPKQRTAIQDFVSAIKQTLMANIKGDRINAEQPSLGMLLAKTFAQQGSEAEAFAAAWANGRKKVRGMLAEMGIEEGNLDAELDAIMPPTPTLAYAPAAARKAVSNAMREAGLMRSDLLNDPTGSKKAIMEKFDEAAKSANLTEEGWDKKGRALAEKAVDESIAEAKMAQERAKKVAKILSEQADKPVSLEEFGAKLAEFRFKKDKISELFNRAKKLAERKIQMANDQAIRVLLAAENKLAQSAFFNAAEKPDTIVKAFREQVEEPMERDAFKKRMEKMLVTPEMADKLFDKAARERDNARWKKAQDILEGPKALGNLLREMNKARPADSVPLKRAMPWRKILSSKPKDVAEYRQRILEAVSSIESFQNLTEEQKERLADLYAEAWEERRQAILDRMLRDEIKKARDRDEISDDVEKKLQQSRNKILEIINLGGFNNDDLVKILGERYGISTSFTEEQKARIQKLADQLQDEDMNAAKRNKLAMEFAVELAGAMDVPVTEIIANWWTSSVLFGPQTIFSIGAAFLNGGYSITTIGTRRMLAKLFKGDVQGSLEESILMLKGIARYLGAFKQAGRRAWNYLWSGDVGLLGIGSNDILSEISNFEQLQKFQRHKLLAEQLAKDPKRVRRYVGMYLRFVSRLLTALDAFNVMVTKAGTASLALRMSGMSTENIIKAENMLNLKAYKDQVIRDYFDNKAPRTPYEKGLVDSYAEAEMYRAIDKMGGKMENADYLASESAMTMHPTGFGGVIYDAIRGFFAQRQSNADEYLEKMKKDWVTRKDLTSVTFLALAYLRQFAAYNAAGLTGSKFVRYASNKFNQGLSFIPFAGLLRQLESKDDRIKGKDAFIETIYRNQVIGALMLFIGGAVLGAIEDEPDDEERGTFWNGGWANLTPDQKKQLLAKGQKEYTMGFKYNGRWYVFNYQNWPLNQMLSAIGSMSDQIRFSPKQWNEKNLLSKTVAGMVSGVKSTLEIPALSGLQELVGNRLASKDPTEQSLDRISRVASGWVGGFVPRILKDIDFATQPELRKYETLWEKTASHIPIYRRYVGEDYYDILGKPIKRNVIPGSREFMMGPTEPEYKILGALNSRNIFLTPANAEYRMVGKGRNRRRLTQEEADAYSLETGKGYRQMLLRYGQRALQMPTERARAFLSDKADEVRDRALKKVYRGYTK